jgi:hypothetical protein
MGDGGFAFPVLEEYTKFNEATGQYEDYYAPHGGMSLRDYFATKAMQALIAHYGDEGDDPKCASLAYGFADAMLAERSK